MVTCRRLGVTNLVVTKLNQVTFSSINYGTDTSAEGRCVIRELLNTTYRGVGNGATAIFPIQIWKKKRGVNYLEGDPNYDLFLQACKVSAKRFFPNFLNLDATFNQHEKWSSEDPERFKYEVATMGCVDGFETVRYKIGDNTFHSSIETMWNTVSEGLVGSLSGLSTYVEPTDVSIWDAKNGWVKVKKVIKNPDKGDWMSVTLRSGDTLLCTSDHPFPTAQGRKMAKELTIQDKLPTVPYEFREDRVAISLPMSGVKSIEFLGDRGEPSFDVETESDFFDVSGFYSHNCRTRVFEDRFGESTSIGRGNLSFTTINLPRIALSALSQEDPMIWFFEELKKMMDATAKQLLVRLDFQKEAKAKQFPLLMSGMWKDSETLTSEDNVGDILNTGTLGIGFIGLAETLIALTGHHHGENTNSQELGVKIVKFMHDHIKGLAAWYDKNFSLLATPAEGLSGKFVKKDKKDFGVIAGVTDKDYYTNSNHVPVYYKCSATHKAQIEAPYHELTRGGHIFYVEIDGDATHNPQVILDTVALMDKHNMGYVSVNHNRNRCVDCGHENAERDLKTCPKCGSTNIDTLQRITGYLTTTVNKWNSGKRAEFKDRIVHD